MALVQVLVIGLAAWRLSALLVYEDGPFRIFERFRTLIGIDPNGGVISSGFLPQLFTCIYCTSVWVAVLMWLLWLVAWWIPGVLAAAAVALVTERITKP